MLCALVPAAGSGERFGSRLPKVLLEVAGRPALSHAVERLLLAGVDGVWVALPEEWVSRGRELLGVAERDDRLRLLAGGRDRQESVELCLSACAEDPRCGDQDLVLVHDGARPAVHPEDIERTVAMAEAHGAALLGRPITDTLKRISEGRVETTVDRTRLFRAETPQVATRSLLVAALRAARERAFRGTDESSLLEAHGVAVWAVEALHPNPKLTYPSDQARIETLLSAKLDWARPRANELSEAEIASQ